MPLHTQAAVATSTPDPGPKASLQEGTLRLPKFPLCSNNSHSGSSPNRVILSPYLGWEAKSTRRAKCHLEPENQSFLELGLLNSFGLPTVQKRGMLWGDTPVLPCSESS